GLSRRSARRAGDRVRDSRLAVFRPCRRHYRNGRSIPRLPAARQRRPGCEPSCPYGPSTGEQSPLHDQRLPQRRLRPSLRPFQLRQSRDQGEHRHRFRRRHRQRAGNPRRPRRMDRLRAGHWVQHRHGPGLLQMASNPQFRRLQPGHELGRHAPDGRRPCVRKRALLVMRPLPASLRRFSATLRRFGRAQKAAAAVEFALILPVMLTLYVGSIELSAAFSMDQRVITIAGTVGDLVARTNGTLAASDLTNYFQAAQAIMAPYSPTKLEQVVSVVAVDSSGNTKVEWSVGYNGGSAQTCGQPYSTVHPIPTAMTNISEGSIIIVSEASYVYPPLLGLFFKNSFNFYHQNFYLPRYDKDIPYSSGC